MNEIIIAGLITIGLVAIYANWIPSKKRKIEQGCHTCNLAGRIENKEMCDRCYPSRMRNREDGTWFYPGWEERII